MILKIVTPPAIEPITVDELKAHCRIDGHDEDTLLVGYIIAARSYLEDAMSRAFITQTFRLFLNSWPGSRSDYLPHRTMENWLVQKTWSQVELPRPPLQAVSSIKYTDIDALTTTLPTSVYQVDAESEPGRVVLAYGQSWPTATLRVAVPIQIEYTAGYGDAADDVPPYIRQAIKLLAAHWYENREATITGQATRDLPFAVQSLININRVFS